MEDMESIEITIKDVYYAFRKAQAQKNNRGFRMPKDFDKHLETKMSEKNTDALILASKFFNTKWRNIDPYRFMECGFELFKSFTYTKFFDQRVLNFYKQRDKHIKRDALLSKEKMSESLKFIKGYIKENNIPSIGRYCMMKRGSVNIVIEHYLNNYVDKYFLIWLIKIGKIKLDDDNRVLVPIITEQYRDVLAKLEEINGFLTKLKELVE